MHWPDVFCPDTSPIPHLGSVFLPNVSVSVTYLDLVLLSFFYVDVAAQLTPVPKIPVTTPAYSTGSGGKRKRKIQLVSSHRDDHISLVRSAAFHSPRNPCLYSHVLQ